MTPPSSPPSGPSDAQAAARKRNLLFLSIGGGCLLLFMLALVAAGVGIYLLSDDKPKPQELGRPGATPEKTYPENPPPTPTVRRAEPVVVATPVPTRKAAPLRVHFFSNPPDVTGSLKEHFFDCLFAYPNGWIKDPNSGQGRTFVELKMRPAGSDTSAESFALSYWARSQGGTEEEQIEAYASAVSASFARSTRNYREVSKQPIRFGGPDVYELKFAAENQTGRPLWGRVLFFLPQNRSQQQAPVVFMTATDLAPEVRSPDDVGVKGDLPLILATLRWGEQVAKLEPVLQQQTAGNAGILFTLLDHDGNSSLTGPELLGGQLQRFDANADGRVTREEFESANAGI